ncbi:MAG: hypothetical protein CMN57_02085 [Gammaproteobacteria bacterium]|nr:hypothetical protein [Gammaproteobacteria bacterium]
MMKSAPTRTVPATPAMLTVLTLAGCQTAYYGAMEKPGFEKRDILVDGMRRAERRIEPVLNAFRDRVLFLKHNLNAQAISALRADRAEVESDIAALVAEMNASIAEADAFIQRMSAD